MQANTGTPSTVTPNPFAQRRRTRSWLCVLGLGVALATPAHAAKTVAPSPSHAKPGLELTVSKRPAALAKSAGPLSRLRGAAPELLRIEIVDRQGASTKRIELELLVNKARGANLETQIDRNQYELRVSPASTPGLLRIDVRRRGAESFQLSTLVDPQRPTLLYRVGSGTSYTTIKLLGVRPSPRAQRRKR